MAVLVLSDLANIYDVLNNRCQVDKIARDFLQSEDFDIDRFDNKCCRTMRIPWKLNQYPMMTTPRPSRNLRKSLQEETGSGKFKLGQSLKVLQRKC